MLTTCFPPRAQLWRHDPKTGCLHSKLNGLVADVAGESSRPGSKLITWTETARANQKFRVDKVAAVDGAVVVQLSSELTNGGRTVVLGVPTNMSATSPGPEPAEGGGGGGGARKSWLWGGPKPGEEGRVVNPGSRVVTVDADLAELGSTGGALSAWRVHPKMA